MQMYVSFNFLICLVALTCAILLYRKTDKYHNAAGFMLFFCLAAGIGGISHAIDIYGMESAQSFTNWVNQTFAKILEHPMSKEGMIIRIWYLTVIGIGFAEYFFMFIFLEPLTEGKLKWIKYLIRGSLVVYLILITITSQYITVVAFHIFSHAIVIALSAYLIIKHKNGVFLYLLLLLLFNVFSGVLQQLMKRKIIPEGPLHFNDWYHISLSVFLIATYLLVVKGKVIEHIDEAAKQGK